MMKKFSALFLALLMLVSSCLVMPVYAWNKIPNTEPPPSMMKERPEIYWSPFDDGVAAPGKEFGDLPPLGLNTWNAFGSDITEEIVKAMGDSFIRLGLDKLGYEYIVVDDGCYAPNNLRDENDRMLNHPTKFPSGFKALADYIHGLGLKYGMYQDVGTSTCNGQHSGTWGREDLDALTFAEWGVDYVKYDYCNNAWENTRYNSAPYIRSIKVTGNNVPDVRLLAAVDGVISVGNKSYEAATYNPSATRNTNGEGHVQGITCNTTTSSSGDLTFTVTALSAGKYNLSVEYAGGANNGRWLQTDVNGKRVIDELVTATANTSTFAYTIPIEVDLKAGDNTIRIYCEKRREVGMEEYGAFYDGINKAYEKTGHKIQLSLCDWGNAQPWLWGYKVGLCWRTTTDIVYGVDIGAWNDSGRGIKFVYDRNVMLDDYAGLDKGWNDPDMLVVGARNRVASIPPTSDGRFSFAENESHFNAWAIMNSTIMLGTDLRNVSVGDDVWKVISNKDVLALNQDPLGIQAKRIKILQPTAPTNPDPRIQNTNSDRIDFLAKPLANGDVGLMIFNLGSTENLRTGSITIDEIINGESEFKNGIGHKMVNKDAFASAELFKVSDLGAKSKETFYITKDTPISATLMSHASKTYRISPIVDVFEIASPDGKIVATTNLDENGSLTYSVMKDGVPYINTSNMGLNTALCDFTSGLSLVSAENKVIDETYPMISGKKSVYTNKANELTLTFAKDGHQFKIIWRAYDDGAAFRYAIDGIGEDASSTTAIQETTSYSIPTGYEIYAQPNNCSNGNNFEDYYRADFTGPTTNAYRPTSGYTAATWPTDYCYPAMINPNNGEYALISFAELNGTYNGSYLRINNNNITTRYADVVRIGSTTSKVNQTITLDFPFKSNWNFIIIGDPATLFDSTMAENLSEPCKLDDTSWIDPGITTWTWLNNVNPDVSHQYPDEYRKYIDLAAEMGWKYILFDEGWQPLDSRPASEKGNNRYRGMFDWFNELLVYAEEKGIGVLVWADLLDLDTETDREVLAEWRDLGIKGIKVDFYNGDNQDRLKLYDIMNQAAADAKLMINHHGSNIPSGERRTYPHVLNREGVRGHEWIKWEAYVSASQNVFYTFIRNVIGPMDFTPLINPIRWRSGTSGAGSAAARQTTAFLLALPVIQEGGLMCFADLAENYRQPGIQEFLTDIPNTWDDSKLLSGSPGKLVTTSTTSSSYSSSVATDASAVVARRKGVNWYVGGITVSAIQDYQLSLDFLGDGYYRADIYTDLDNLNYTSTFGVKSESRFVTKDDIIALSLLARGGFAIKLTKVFEASQTDSGITAEYYNSGSSSKDIKLVIAIYNEEKLAAFEIKDVTIPSGDSGSVTLAVDKSDYIGCTYKAFAWDSDYVPLVDAIKGTIKAF